METVKELPRKAAREIKKALIDAGVSQRELVGELGISPSYLCRIINGTYPNQGKRSDRIREAIAQRVGRTVEEIWGPE